MQEKKLYTFCGGVFNFERLVIHRWKAQTLAVSDTKAVSNLKFQAKKELKLAPNAVIRLDGKVVCAG